MSSKDLTKIENPPFKNRVPKIEGPTNVQHISHVTWSKEKGFEINTDDEELGNILRGVLCPPMELKTEEDVIEYVSTEFETTTHDNDIYISYPFNVRHNVHCSRNDGSNKYNIIKDGSVVKLHIEPFLKKYSEDK